MNDRRVCKVSCSAVVNMNKDRHSDLSENQNLAQRIQAAEAKARKAKVVVMPFCT